MSQPFKTLFYSLMRGFFRPMRAIWAQFHILLQKTNFFKTLQSKRIVLFSSGGKDKCISCQLCVAACPTSAIFISVREDRQGLESPDMFLLNEDLCIQCGLCERACPVDALGLILRSLLEGQSNEPVLSKKQLYFDPALLKEE